MVVSIADGALELVERRKLVDRYGELDREVKSFEPKRREHESLGKTIRSWYDSPADAEREFVASGLAWDVKVSPRPNERHVTSYPRLYRILKRDKFVELATITLKLIERNVPEALHHKFLKTEASGTRRLQAVPRSPVVPLPAGVDPPAGVAPAVFAAGTGFPEVKAAA